MGETENGVRPLEDLRMPHCIFRFAWQRIPVIEAWPKLDLSTSKGDILANGFVLIPIASQQSLGPPISSVTS